MQRRSFLSFPLLAPLAFQMPSLDGASADRPTKGLKVDAGQDRSGKSFTYLGARFDLKVSGKDTDGAMSIYDTTRFEKKGPPLHRHHDVDEWFFVLEGEFKFRVGEEIFRLKAGDSLFGPRGVPHAFVKTSEAPARLLLMHQPAGTMEEYFHTVIGLENPTLVQRQALLRKHGMEPVGPPLTPD
jgi:mannose-6-phosphate isomerase-like protein (cupin superfamily)